LASPGDERAMRMAIAAARRAEGRTHPNPPVGAVLVRGERVLARGTTRPVGGPHAEIVAIAAAQRRHGARALRGATLLVTLEPCAHQGRTGPCSEAIVAAGIGRVVIGHRDPSPWVGGRGLRRLRAAGVRVETGVLEEECRYLHRGFLSVIERGRPFVALKLAASLDGRIATARGESRWITGERARALVHRLRDRADALWVGAETARLDDPALDVRRGARIVRRPVRVVADSQLRVPARARLHDAPGQSIALCVRGAPPRRRAALERAGVRVLPVRARAGRVDLRAGLEALAAEGLSTVLVEGGGELAGALLARDLVDELHWFVAPKLLGGDGRAALGPIGADRLSRAVVLDAPEVRRMGKDLYVRGLVRRAGSSG
jgi:diaminohydroxyphosphoribosylaminopyrimidine deaminase/5-amino-6-(5-phosphoribosylamino)uracil reductase